MPVLDLARRLFFTGALLLFGGVAISVMSHDAWLAIAHAAGIVGAIIAALAFLLLLAAGLRRIGLARSSTPIADTAHEQGQVGLD